MFDTPPDMPLLFEDDTRFNMEGEDNQQMFTIDSFIDDDIQLDNGCSEMLTLPSNDTAPFVATVPTVAESGSFLTEVDHTPTETFSPLNNTNVPLQHSAVQYTNVTHDGQSLEQVGSVSNEAQPTPCVDHSVRTVTTTPPTGGCSQTNRGTKRKTSRELKDRKALNARSNRVFKSRRMDELRAKNDALVAEVSRLRNEVTMLAEKNIQPEKRNGTDMMDMLRWFALGRESFLTDEKGIFQLYIVKHVFEGNNLSAMAMMAILSGNGKFDDASFARAMMSIDRRHFERLCEWSNEYAPVLCKVAIACGT